MSNIAYQLGSTRRGEMLREADERRRASEAIAARSPRPRAVRPDLMSALRRISRMPAPREAI